MGPGNTGSTGLMGKWSNGVEISHDGLGGEEIQGRTQPREPWPFSQSGSWGGLSDPREETGVQGSRVCTGQDGCVLAERFELDPGRSSKIAQEEQAILTSFPPPKEQSLQPMCGRGLAEASESSTLVKEGGLLSGLGTGQEQGPVSAIWASPSNL